MINKGNYILYSLDSDKGVNYNVSMLATKETMMKRAADYPRGFAVNQTVLEQTMGITPSNYSIEVINTRTLKHKMIHDVKAVRENCMFVVFAPRGYRITRAWRKNMTEEVFIQQ